MIQSHLTRSMSRHLVRMKMDNFSRRRRKGRPPVTAVALEDIQPRSIF